MKKVSLGFLALAMSLSLETFAKGLLQQSDTVAFTSKLEFVNNNRGSSVVVTRVLFDEVLEKSSPGISPETRTRIECRASLNSVPAKSTIQIKSKMKVAAIFSSPQAKKYVLTKNGRRDNKSRELTIACYGYSAVKAGDVWKRTATLPLRINAMLLQKMGMTSDLKANQNKIIKIQDDGSSSPADQNDLLIEEET